MVSELANVKPVIDKYKGQKRALIPVLQDVQEKCNWLPPEVLRYVAQSLDIPLIDVYSVATFYASFRLQPRGRHLCTSCMGTACHVRGAPIIYDHLERRLGIRAGETTADMKYSLERVNCLGACALAPLVVVDGEYYGQMNVTKMDSVLRQIESRETAAQRARSQKSKARKATVKRTQPRKPKEKVLSKKGSAKKQSKRKSRP